MVSLELLIMVSAIVLCVGGLLGAVISRTLLPPEKQKDLESRLEDSRTELEQYQQDVAKHFADTSKLVTNLTNAYKEVHDHLSKGALQLTNAEISKKILAAGEESLGIDTKGALEQVDFEPPKDWAPKSPGQKGTLSEEFGLERDAEEESIEAITAGKR